MKPENQHLDFLISQYVDGTLEGAGKKSVEQKLLHDPEARKLYADHRETQDILDDYGSRIPMVNWSEFDKKLEARLEIEAAEKQRINRFRRRMKPIAVAAALLVAVSLGYAAHALSRTTTMSPQVTNSSSTPDAPRAVVSYPEGQTSTKASQIAFRIDEPVLGQAAGEGHVDGLAFSAPAEQVALQALQANVTYGVGNLPGDMRFNLNLNQGSSVGSTVGSSATPTNTKEDPTFIVH